jgi:hypothetical protein
MTMTAEKIRLRVPLPDDKYRELQHKAYKLKQAQEAQPPLTWKHSFPLSVGFWKDTPKAAKAAAQEAIKAWNSPLGDTAFRLVGESEIVHIVLGVQPFEIHFDAVQEFGSSTVGFLLPHRRSGIPIFGSSQADELGDCEHFWDKENRIIACKVFSAIDLTPYDMKATFAHELGHALCLGHDPHNPWRLMYRRYGGIAAPKPREVQWVKEIHGL